MTRVSTWMLVRRSLRQYLLSTVVTACSIALATGLVMAVLEISEQSRRAFSGSSLGFDAVLGARGSQLQLVLNAVFHLEASPGKIPWSLYRAIAAEPGVEQAIPLAVGDNYRGYRIAGTTPEFFSRRRPAQRVALTIEPGGAVFREDTREAVIGSVVATRTGLRVGSEFHPYHGLVYAETNQHNETYRVTAVLEPTNSPADRVVWVPIESVYRMGGHVLQGAGQVFVPEAGATIPEEHREVSAVLIALSDPQAGFALDQLINRQGTVATLAWPIGRVMAELFERLGWMSRVLTLVAYLVMLVAAGAIVASLHNTLHERRREFAILRALGAHRRTVCATVVGQAASIAAAGALMGLVVRALILVAAAAVIRDQTGVVLDVWQPTAIWGLVPGSAILLGASAGLIPAWRAYTSDVADGLAPQS